MKQSSKQKVMLLLLLIMLPAQARHISNCIEFEAIERCIMQTFPQAEKPNCECKHY